MAMSDKDLDTWVAALRSGEYKQCRGSLYTNAVDDLDSRLEHPAYCCIGVFQPAV